MKILYIGHFSEYPTGWGTAALNYLLAMDSVGLNVVPRSIVLGKDNRHLLPKRYFELEAKNTTDCTVIIQHILPHLLKFSGTFDKNIALCVYELFGNKYASWNNKINMMDQLWVPSLFTYKCFQSADVKIPIKIVPHTFNMSVYEKKYQRIQNPELDSNYIFYTIADLNVRKNLHSLVQAFHLEFTPNEPVSLIIKSSKYGLSPTKTFEIIKGECDKIKQHMKLYVDQNLYKPEHVVPEELSEEQIMELHSTGNCYVNTSHGEAFCIPLFDAVAFGKDVVCPELMYDYISDANAYQVQTRDNIVFGYNDTFPEMGSSRETWIDLDIKHLCKQMRAAFVNRNTVEGAYKRNESVKISKEFSYEKIGNKIKEYLGV